MPDGAIRRRDFLHSGLAAAALFAFGCRKTTKRSDEPFDLGEASVTQLRQLMETGTLTSAALVEQYQARIDQFDRQGPRLNSMIELNPDAADIARRLDDERGSATSISLATAVIEAHRS